MFMIIPFDLRFDMGMGMGTYPISVKHKPHWPWELLKAMWESVEQGSFARYRRNLLDCVSTF